MPIVPMRPYRKLRFTAFVTGEGRLQEGHGADGLFVGKGIGAGDAGGIADATMHIFPADTA